MHKLLKGSSIVALLALLVSFLTVSPVLAAQEGRIDVMSGRGAYVTITNVVEEDLASWLFVAEGSATVTFHGKNLVQESIYYAADVTWEGDRIIFPDDVENVAFDVKQYKDYGEGDVLDETVKEPEGFPVYEPGNYATLTKPGYYMVMTGPEAAAATIFAIHVAAGSVSEPAPAPAPAPAEIQAVPTSSKVLVNGEAVAFGAYQINGNNYFKLRDLAKVLSGSEKQFEVTWDAEKNAINLVTGKAYTTVGGELAVAENPQPQIATPTASKIYLNGEEVRFTAYTIGGNNYFKLRDIGKAMNFGVTWDASANSIGIDSSTGYTE